MDSFVEKLKVVTDAEAKNITALLRQSRAAAAFDAVVAFALAYDEILQNDEFALEHQNISRILNDTLSGIKFNGLSVSCIEVVLMIRNNFLCRTFTISRSLRIRNSVFWSLNLLVHIQYHLGEHC